MIAQQHKVTVVANGNSSIFATIRRAMKMSFQARSTRGGNEVARLMHTCKIYPPYLHNMSATEQKLLQWGSTQGHILTGGGILEAQSIPGVHFQEEHLAHYWLKKRVTKQILRQWLDRNFRSFSIVGAWDRPLFSGGWMESTEHDTESFNLQTPSIFIDMRIPKLRPTAHIRTRENLASCSDNELRLLARQHCFAGYSFPEPDKSIEKSGALVFTRHHIIDWNYHPSFPRSRPNRWWVQTKDVENSKEGTDSFKEFSTVRDKFNNPVYMVRLYFH